MSGQFLSRASAKPQASFSPVCGSRLQRKCACGGHTSGSGDCEECGKNRMVKELFQGSSLQRRASNPSSPNMAPLIVHDVLGSPGQPLDTATQKFFEPRFGHDFSHVRVHTDGRAAESARAVNALAYTVGHNVVFGAGRYSPSTSDGRGLLAHELTHVVQQGNSTSGGTRRLSLDSPGNEQEAEAERVAGTVLQGSNSTTVKTSYGARMQRQQVVAAAATSCPTSSSLDTFLKFNHGDLPSGQQANFRTYLGVLVRHGLDPGPDHTGHCIQEELSLVSTDCPAALTAATRPCSKSDCLPVNRGGQDRPTGKSLSSSRRAFLDIHRSTSARSLLEGTGVNSCQVICEQKYHCDSLAAPVLAVYRITRNFQAGTYTPPGGTPQHITTGSVDKDEVFGMGDFPSQTLPRGEQYA